MKDIVVSTVALILGALGPQIYRDTPFDPMWLFGLLVLIAYSCGRLTWSLRFPPIIGWFLSGIIIGQSGLQLVLPEDFTILYVVRQAAVAWIGFHVSLYCFPVTWIKSKRQPLFLLFSTVCVAVSISFILLIFVGLQWDHAVVIGSFSALWAPFTGVPNRSRVTSLQISAAGMIISVLLLTCVLQYLVLEKRLVPETQTYIFQLYFSIILGGLSAVLIDRFNLWPRTAQGLFFGFFGACIIVAILFQSLELYVLPFATTAGAVIAYKSSWQRKLRYTLHRVGEFPYLVYIALMGATLNLGFVLQPINGIISVAVVVSISILLLRGVWVAAKLQIDRSTSPIVLGREIMVRGILPFELCYQLSFDFLDIMVGNSAEFLRQFVTLDILISVLFYVLLGRLLTIFLSLWNRRFF